MMSHLPKNLVPQQPGAPVRPAVDETPVGDRPETGNAGADRPVQGSAHEAARGAGAHMTELRPHRSLSGPAFKVLMAVFCVVSVAVGGFFLWLGAWPVTGYFGLDLLAIYLAFRWNYRAGRVCERVEVNADKLVLTRVAPSGTESAWEFNPYWARIERHQQTPNCSVLELTSHGERVAFGKFLTEEEKASVADRLQNVLRTFRETGRVPAT